MPNPPLRIGLVLIGGVLLSVPAGASLYINTPSGYQHLGGPAREGPFATRAQAEAFLQANFPGWSTSNIVGSEDVQPGQTQGQVDNSAAQREAEEKAAAEKKAAEEQAARDKAARAAEDARRFQKIRDDATRQLKGFNQATGQQLKGVDGSGVAGLKEAPKTTRAAINSDPKVVDLHNLPSGLPKDLDAAINGGYASAPPGVSDRVGKGFQAVMARDWKVAKAWFEDALNHDPTNAGLKRLVALADSAEVAKPPATPRSPTQSVQLPAKDDAMLLFDPDGWGLIHPTGTAADQKILPIGTDAADDFLLINDPFHWRRKHPDWWKEIPKEPNVTTTLPDGTLQIQLPHPRLLETDPESWNQLHPNWWKNIPAKAVIISTTRDGKLMMLPNPSDSENLFPATEGPKLPPKDGPHN